MVKPKHKQVMQTIQIKREFIKKKKRGTKHGYFLIIAGCTSIRANNLLSMKFIIANVGPTLSNILKVSKLICPLLNAIIVNACSNKQPIKFSTQDEQTTCNINKKLYKQAENLPGTSKPERSKDDGNFDTSEGMFDAQQRCFYQSANSK